MQAAPETEIPGDGNMLEHVPKPLAPKGPGHSLRPPGHSRCSNHDFSASSIDCPEHSRAAVCSTFSIKRVPAARRHPKFASSSRSLDDTPAMSCAGTDEREAMVSGGHYRSGRPMICRRRRRREMSISARNVTKPCARLASGMLKDEVRSSSHPAKMTEGIFSIRPINLDDGVKISRSKKIPIHCDIAPWSTMRSTGRAAHR